MIAPDSAQHLPQPLKVLMLEDNEADAELCSRELRKAGFVPEVEIVRTGAEFSERISAGIFDLILDDDSLPAGSGPEALEFLKQRRRNIPFILVTGTMPPEAAQACLQKGAVDVVLKDPRSRVALAVRVALERRAMHQRLAALETRLRESEQRRVEDASRSLAAFPQLNPNPVLEFSREGSVTYFNDAALQMAKSIGCDHPSAALPTEVASIVRTCLASGQKRAGIETAAGGRKIGRAHV